MGASDPERSVCFDRAAGYYDETRSLPAEGRDRVLEILRSSLPDGGLCLDIGVGTGRTALPLTAAGVRLVGIDLSLAMMAKAVAKSGGHQPFPLVAADGTTLPFTDNSFDGAMIIHVLHSVPRWEDAIAEAVRVVRPGGVIVLDTGDGRTDILDDIEARFKMELPEQTQPTRWTVESLDAAFRRYGCTVGLLPAVELQFERAPAELLDKLERGVASWQWSMDARTFGPAADRVRTWAEEQFGALDQPRSFTTTVQMREYRVRAS
jgi:ubiquinone/menaquinone biosynthesis C-methylase UbiE